MPEPLGDGFTVTVDALVDVLLDPATQRTFADTASKLGKTSAKALTEPISKAVGGLTGDLNKALSAANSSQQRQKIVADTQKSIEQIVRAAAQGNQAAADLGVRVLRQVLVTAERTGQAARQSLQATAVATAQVDSSARAAVRATGQASDGTDELVAALKKVFPVVKGNEDAFKALSGVIVAETNKAAKAISEGIVKEQSRQQQESVLKQQRQIALQQEKAAARERQAVLQAGLREEEQVRQASNRSVLASQKSALAQENAAFNASLQSNLIEEKGFQQRRTALVRAGLDATRSLYKSLASGTTSVISGSYNLLRSATKSGEDSLTAENKRGLLARKAQTEQLIAQTTASARAQLTASNKAQAQLQSGVLGAATGQSPLTGILGGIAIGGAGALGLSKLVGEASGFEGNLRVFQVLNEELQRTPALMNDVRQTALDLGRDIALPGVSASDAAAAITALAKTGLPLKDSIDAARGSLLLARSTGVDFAESARTIGSTLQALNIDATDATKVVDGFTSALRFGGGATFDELRLAQSQSLLVFKSAFQGVEQPLQIMNELNASLALFSRNALRGSDAGTSLKRFIQVLPGVTSKASNTISDALKNIGEAGNFAFDDKGRARTFAESIDLVRESMLALDPAARAQAVNDIFGTDAARAAQVFIDTTSGELDQLIRDIARSEGITEKLAKAQNQGIKAAADAFVSTIETIFIVSFKQVDKLVGNVVNTISSVIDKLAFDPAWKAVRGAIIGVATALAAVLAVKAGVEVLKLIGIALSAIATPAGLVVAALAAVGGAIGFLLAQSEPLRQALSSVFSDLKDGAKGVASGPLAEVANFFGEIRQRVERAAEVVGFFIALLIDDDLRKRFIEWQGLDANAEKEGLFGWFLKIRQEIPQLIGTVVDTFKNVVSFISKVATDPAFETFRKAVVGVATGLVAVAGGLAAIAAARKGLGALSSVASLLAGFATPLGVVAVAFAAVGGALFVLYQKSEPFRQLVDSLFGTLKDLATQVLKAALPAIERFASVVRDAASSALAVFSDAIEAIVKFVGSEGFANALESVGRIVGGIIETVARAFSTVIDFITAVARTIKEVGVFEGLRQAVEVAFGAIVGVVGSAFSGIGNTIKGVFDNINWAAVAATAALGIFNFFQTIGRTVGRFIGSKEFLTTVVTALGVLAGALASAASGLISGFIDGLRKSDAGEQVVEFFKTIIGLGTDAVKGAGDTVADAFRQATIDGITLALSAAFPPELFRRLLTDPLDSALGAAVLLVEVLFIGKIVGLFVSGIGKIRNAVAGIKVIGTVLQGGIGTVGATIGKVDGEAQKVKGTLDAIGRQYGPVTQKAAAAAQAVAKFGGANKEVTATSTTVTRNLDAQTAAIRANESITRGLLTTKRDEAAVNTQVAGSVSKVTDNYVTLAATIAGGAIAGAGIGTALTADDPLGVIGGITAAIGGIGTIAVTTAQVVAASGLTAGLLTGGVGLAVLAITAAVTFFTTRKNDLKANADQVKQVKENYLEAFKAITAEAKGSRAAAALLFIDQLGNSTDKAFKQIREDADKTGTSLADIAAAVTGSGDAANDFLVEQGRRIGEARQALEAARGELRALEIESAQGSPAEFKGSIDAAEARVAAAERELTAQTNLQTGVITLRGEYEKSKDLSSAELTIREKLRDIQAEHTSEVENTLVKQREQRDILDQQVRALLDIKDLEAGRIGDTAALDLRQGLRGIADQFKADAQGNIAASFAAPIGSAQNDAALQSLEGLKTSLAEVVILYANQAANQAEFDRNFAAVQDSFKQTLIDAGVAPEIAAQIVDQLVNSVRTGDEVVTAFLTGAADNIEALRSKLEDQPWVAKILAEADTTLARDTLAAFIAEPDSKDIAALFDLGVPKADLERFINDPTEKNIQPILDALNQADQAELAALAAVINKKVVLQLDSASVARVNAQIAANGSGVPFSTAALEIARNRDLNGNGIIGNKYGSVITKPVLSWLGEEGRKEVVIPLTMPQRAAQLYEQSGLADVLARAGVSAPAPASAPAPPARSSVGSARAATAELTQLVAEMQALRSELREDMDERRDNVFQIQGVVDQPIATAREVAATMRRRRRRG